MYIKLCDRCGHPTDNKAAFLLPVESYKGSYSVDGTWFGDPVCLCNDCLKEFQLFQNPPRKYKIELKLEEGS